MQVNLRSCNRSVLEIHCTATLRYQSVHFDPTRVSFVRSHSSIIAHFYIQNIRNKPKDLYLERLELCIGFMYLISNPRSDNARPIRRNVKQTPAPQAMEFTADLNQRIPSGDGAPLSRWTSASETKACHRPPSIRLCNVPSINHSRTTISIVCCLKID